MQWVKVESINKGLQGVFHICQSSNDKTECLSVAKDEQSGGNFIITLNSYIKLQRTNTYLQQWRLNPNTSQLVNVGTGLCLTSFNSKRIFNTSVIRLLVGVEVCNRGTKITRQQKWSFDSLPKC